MKKSQIIVSILFVLLLFSCGQNKTTEKHAVTAQPQKTIVVVDSLYKIISEKDHVDPRFGFNKCNIEIELKAKISIDELKSIAYKLRETRSTYDKLWIFYNLPNKQVGSAAWATTHFTPNLEVEISGSTSKEDEKMNSVSVDGKIIGRWQDAARELCMIIYEKNSEIFMKHTFSDGSNGDYEFIKKKYNGKMRFEPKQNTHHEYYLIENNGNLGMYGENGKFSEAVKITDKPGALQNNINKTNEKEVKKYIEAPKEEVVVKQSIGIDDKDFAQKAFVISKTFVKQNIKSPKSADFPFSDYTYSNVKDNTITIRSYVDAQNAFGAEIRNNYVIVLKLVGGDWSDSSNWRMLSLRFE